MKPNFHVVVVETKTGHLAARFDVGGSKRKAEKIEAGVNVNLDHDRFHTEIWEQA